MARPKKAKSRKSPINQKERELADQQHQLQVQIEALQRSIEEAPRRAAEEERRAREIMIDRAHERGVGRGIGAITDKRSFGGAGGRPSPGPRGRRGVRPPVLRAERRAAQLKTLALVIGLLVLGLWLLTYLHW